ncbi:heavy-metal-associated domain-containing protein [Ferruginibacter lapsinanis]|uniref:heavy-metal-associated domain-containing protein n=1 Tax=Ferruginibacter lapsinanis TaxID=563172 RepID=UPI001E5252B4|nr:heavy metal-associated domain-containing protein [Ferruginibacter lapsinanis]UEG48664.1 heavy-metal-associated domain-containing protein [Ferruginibacter lapsinanis]
MTHTYKVTGMTCSSCEAKVKSSLLLLPDVTAVAVSKEKQTATITMEKHIPLSVFQHSLNEKYTISAIEHNETAEQAKSWVATYKPILLIFAYITAIALIAAIKYDAIDWMHGMNVFMAGFFLAFSFFKLLDLNGFADSYAMYDIVAKKWRGWGFVYPFIELGLGISYTIGFQSLLTNIVTIVVMTVSIIGVLKSVFNKRKIQCACLGAVFNLPMSTVTIIEDALMIVMSAVMLFSMLYR